MSDSDLIDRLYDGDLDAELERKAKARLAADPVAAARFERLALLGSLVREVEAERQVPAGLAESVMARLDEPAPSPRVFKRYPAVAAAAGSALALAAAFVLWLGSQPRPAVPTSTGSVSGAPAHLAPTAHDAAFADAPAEPLTVSIESVDFGATQGAIFLVSAGVTDTMVVWTLDEPDPTGRK